MEQPIAIPPHLKAAFEQCKKVLDENDIAGAIILHAETPNGAGVIMFTYKMETTYSCVEYHENKVLRTLEMPESRRVRHTDPPIFEPRDKTVFKTVNMLHNMCDRFGQLFQLFKSAEVLVRDTFGVQAKPGNGKTKKL